MLESLYTTTHTERDADGKGKCLTVCDRMVNNILVDELADKYDLPQLASLATDYFCDNEVSAMHCDGLFHVYPNTDRNWLNLRVFLNIALKFSL